MKLIDYFVLVHKLNIMFAQALMGFTNGTDYKTIVTTTMPTTTTTTTATYTTIGQLL